MMLRSATLLLLCGRGLWAQQAQWQIPSPPSPHSQKWISSYGDYNGDGTRDVLVALIFDELQPPYTLGHRIVSGVDGSTLWERRDDRAQWMVDGGDIDGDGVRDIVMRHGYSLTAIGFEVAAWSVGANTWIWQVANIGGFGEAMLGDVDLTGDGLADFVTATIHPGVHAVFAYDSRGSLLYRLPLFAQGFAPTSFAKMGDLDRDGCDDYVIGCQDVSIRGALLLVSGRTGDNLRISYGLLPGDIIAAHASNVADMDGDGVPDYAGFPWWSASRAMITVFSGRTGDVIRTWPEFANSVVTGEDVDRDGVPDIALGADYNLGHPSLYGRTLAFSGRDGDELWRVDNFFPAPGSGVSHGSSGWMEKSASLGVRAGEHYPSIVWLDQYWYATATGSGRVRAYGTARAGQGPITGTPCTSSGDLPLIGVRKLGAAHANTGFRTTIAKTHANALALLNFAFAPLPAPIDLTFLGLQGCALYVEPQVSYLRATGSVGIDRGYAAVELPYPLSGAAAGTDVVAQWVVLEPVTGAYAATELHAIRLP